MPQSSSFDVTTSVDMQEVDNAVNQAQKEIGQRYDFKGAAVSIELKRAEEQILLTADSDYRMKALFDVLQAKLIKRGVSVKNLDIGTSSSSSAARVPSCGEYVKAPTRSNDASSRKASSVA